jgi:hypothetical protein
VGRGNLNRPTRNVVKSSQLCVVLMLGRTPSCLSLEVSTQVFDVNISFAQSYIYTIYLNIDVVYSLRNGTPLMIKIGFKKSKGSK